MKKIGLFYGAATVKTAKVAEKIKDEFGEANIELMPIDTAWAEDFKLYDTIIIGTSTWFDGELPNYWDEMIPEIESIDLKGKKIALFGLGDQVNYPDNFADGVGIIADALSHSGATLVGFTSTEGYTFRESKAVNDNKFCGLILDIENQSELTPKRITAWIKVLRNEFKLK